MTLGIQVDDASPIPPAPVTTVPGHLPQAAKGSGANDGGALWWDHDDAGGVGAIGFTGFGGFGGVPGAAGPDPPFGLRIIINQSVTGSLPVLIKAGNGQPGGLGGKGGPGGQSGDGGNGDDQQGAAMAGKAAMAGAADPAVTAARAAIFMELTSLLATAF